MGSPQDRASQRSGESTRLYLKEFTLKVDVRDTKVVTAEKLILEIEEACGLNSIFACVPKGNGGYEITVADAKVSDMLKDGISVDGHECFCTELTRRSVVVSFMHLPSYIEDSDIYDKLSDLGVEPISDIRRRYHKGTRVADGTRYLRVLFPPEIKSLPYALKFKTEIGDEYFKVVHNNQIKVCSICLSDEHLYRQCPDFKCHRCQLQGHMAKACTTPECEYCGKPGDRCYCEICEMCECRPCVCDDLYCEECCSVQCTCTEQPGEDETREPEGTERDGKNNDQPNTEVIGDPFSEDSVWNLPDVPPRVADEVSRGDEVSCSATDGAEANPLTHEDQSPQGESDEWTTVLSRRTRRSVSGQNGGEVGNVSVSSESEGPTSQSKIDSSDNVESMPSGKVAKGKNIVRRRRINPVPNLKKGRIRSTPYTKVHNV